MKKAIIKTPLGIAKIEGNEHGVSKVYIANDTDFITTEIPTELKKATLQLQEYFKGIRKEFTFKTNLKGTEFQQKVWKALVEIPHGKTVSYLEISKKIGDVKAIRAVAAANGKNPLWIVVPCHRVIGSDGSLTGYAGGLWRKKWLLDHESPSPQQSLF
ncbi:methylated-DNA--[protein]-cysteine S-methyltransferase [Mesonia aestuariivivens]|uniref:Methylated-DNA--protein-cysteine methyltransferase n=1 Tax=Mesonia aestuariivivens TaxID=2796128 RepID=A0ABS6W1C4_9FLAO|nr:methylated-DNA--[protein]-cysteine S-methyltransferase [Mesonia aestuariivivens]MBW2961656.1 methylated-DNA--[protein]-cysteine S-methyltransferase [Mesonia aestuariivivens]